MTAPEWSLWKKEVLRTNASNSWLLSHTAVKQKLYVQKILAMVLTHKSTRNCWAFLALQNMVSLLTWTQFRRVYLNGCTQKVPLNDLEILTRYLAFFSCMIHEIFFHLFMNLGTRGFGHLPGNQKKFGHEFSLGLVRLFITSDRVLYVFRFSLSNTHTHTHTYIYIYIYI